MRIVGGNVSKELYIIILVAISLSITVDIIDFIWKVLIKRTESATFNIKRLFNQSFRFTCSIGLYVIAIGCVMAYVGVAFMREHLTDYSTYPVVDGLCWMFLLCGWAIQAAIIYDFINSRLRKKPREYDKWIDHVLKDGVWSYTEEEKAIIKKEHDEGITQLRNKFPKIAQWCDKHHKSKVV